MHLAITRHKALVAHWFTDLHYHHNSNLWNLIQENIIFLLFGADHSHTNLNWVLGTLRPLLKCITCILRTSTFNFQHQYHSCNLSSICWIFIGLGFILSYALLKSIKTTYVDNPCCFLVSMISDKVERWLTQLHSIL